MDDMQAGQLPRVRPIKSKFRKIKLINKDIDHLNRIILVDPVFQALRKERALLTIRALNVALHPILQQPNQRCKNHMNHNVFTQPGSCVDGA